MGLGILLRMPIAPAVRWREEQLGYIPPLTPLPVNGEKEGDRGAFEL